MVKVRVVFSLRVKVAFPRPFVRPASTLKTVGCAFVQLTHSLHLRPKDNLRSPVPAIMGCCHESDSEYDLRDHIRSIIQGAHASLSGLRQGQGL